MSIVGSIVGTIAGMLSPTTYPGENFTAPTQENLERIQKKSENSMTQVPDHYPSLCEAATVSTVNSFGFDAAAGIENQVAPAPTKKTEAHTRIGKQTFHWSI